MAGVLPAVCLMFTFLPKSNVLAAITLANPYKHEGSTIPDIPPRGLAVGDVVELYVPTVGGDREPVLEHWDRYLVEEVSPTDQVTIVCCEESPRRLYLHTLGAKPGDDLPRERVVEGETWRLVNVEGRGLCYQADRGSVMRKSLDKSLREGTDWRRVVADAERVA